jgi:hypothetical protein
MPLLRRADKNILQPLPHLFRPQRVADRNNHRDPQVGEADMNGNEYYNDETIAPGLTGAEVRESARRQFIASVAVAVVIALGAGLTVLAPASQPYAEAAARKVAVVQQPSFVAPPGQRLAAMKQSAIELP